MRVAIDARSNVLLVRGNPELTDRVRLLVEELDQPGRRPPALVPVTRVYRLRYADAVRMAEVLRGVIGIGGRGGLENPVAESIYEPGRRSQEPGIADRFEVPEERAGRRGGAETSSRRRSPRSPTRTSPSSPPSRSTPW